MADFCGVAAMALYLFHNIALQICNVFQENVLFLHEGA
jgi:hypothetical protein